MNTYRVNGYYNLWDDPKIRPEPFQRILVANSTEEAITICKMTLRGAVITSSILRDEDIIAPVEASEFQAKLVQQQAAIDFMYKTHPRAMKLLTKGKPFIVVAVDESYFMDVYEKIKSDQIWKRTWTQEDEIQFRKLEEEWSRYMDASEAGKE